MAEHQFYRARYSVSYTDAKRRPTTRTVTEEKLVVPHPSGNGTNQTLDANDSRVGLLTWLGIPFEVVSTTKQVQQKEMDPIVRKTLNEAIETLEEEDGDCRTLNDYGDCIIETKTALGQSAHRKRRAVVEAVYKQLELPFTLECELIFSDQTCKPLTTGDG